MIDEIDAMLKNFGKRFKVAATGVGDTTYERFTLLKIHDYIKPEDKFLYIHSKGVRYTVDDSKESKQLAENIFLWRTWMEYFLIGKFMKCLEKLDTYDVVGVNYTKKEIGPHFSGNFWWSTGRYYLTLPKTIGARDFEPENFILKNPNVEYVYHPDTKYNDTPNVKYFDMDAGRMPENTGLYNTTFYPKEYID